MEARVNFNGACSFATQNRFQALDQELKTQGSSTTTRSIKRRPNSITKAVKQISGDSTPPFITAIRSERKHELKLHAAQQNGTVRTPYQPPSEHSFRAESSPVSWKNPHQDFRLKFALPSNQDLRLRTALDQEGFFQKE